MRPPYLHVAAVHLAGVGVLHVLHLLPAEAVEHLGLGPGVHAPQAPPLLHLHTPGLTFGSAIVSIVNYLPCCSLETLAPVKLMSNWSKNICGQ